MKPTNNAAYKDGIITVTNPDGSTASMIDPGLMMSFAQSPAGQVLLECMRSGVGIFAPCREHIDRMTDAFAKQNAEQVEKPTSEQSDVENEQSETPLEPTVEVEVEAKTSSAEEESTSDTNTDTEPEENEVSEQTEAKSPKVLYRNPALENSANSTPAFMFTQRLSFWNR